jgi:hypothetical protein
VIELSAIFVAIITLITSSYCPCNLLVTSSVRRDEWHLIIRNFYVLRPKKAPISEAIMSISARPGIKIKTDEFYLVFLVISKI